MLEGSVIDDISLAYLKMYWRCLFVVVGVEGKVEVAFLMNELKR
jgi:hypothetical protein